MTLFMTNVLIMHAWKRMDIHLYKIMASALCDYISKTYLIREYSRLSVSEFNSFWKIKVIRVKNQTNLSDSKIVMIPDFLNYNKYLTNGTSF